MIQLAFAARPVQTDPPPSALNVTAGSIAEALRAGGGAVAEAGQDLIAAILWVEKDAGLYLSRLAVHPMWRRRGIARTLIAEAEREALRRGLPRLHLGVRLSLTDNRRLFRSCGFNETERHCHPGYSEPTWVAMEKWLSG